MVAPQLHEKLGQLVVHKHPSSPRQEDMDANVSVELTTFQCLSWNRQALLVISGAPLVRPDTRNCSEETAKPEQTPPHESQRSDLSQQ